MPKKLAWILLLGGLVACAQAAPKVTVYEDPNCGCCHAWAEHMRQSGFVVNEVKTADMSMIKQRFGVPADKLSCHTAVLESGQVVEGHVPASVVNKLLAQPQVKGVAAPGMPQHAPGMGELNGTLVTVDFAGHAFSKD